MSPRGPFRASPPSLVSKAKSVSSRAWLARQFRDPYVKQRSSDPAAYRARSAFKLLEMDSTRHFISRPGVRTVVDLGAAPGGWSQVVAGKLGFYEGMWEDSRGFGVTKKVDATTDEVEAEVDNWERGEWSTPRKLSKSRRRKGKESVENLLSFDPLNIDADDSSIDDIGADGRGLGRKATIVAVDLLPIRPITGVQTIQADFLAPETDSLIQAMLEIEGNTDAKVDLILSDMAANVSGNVVRDVEQSLAICEKVYEFARRRLKGERDVKKTMGRPKGGTLLLKHFTHPLLQRFRGQKLTPNFNSVSYLKPHSSRAESREGYFLCQGWKGLDAC